MAETRNRALSWVYFDPSNCDKFMLLVKITTEKPSHGNLLSVSNGKTFTISIPGHGGQGLYWFVVLFIIVAGLRGLRHQVTITQSEINYSRELALTHESHWILCNTGNVFTLPIIIYMESDVLLVAA
jgi:hypothetical protein